jgi:hypothetical protein
MSMHESINQFISENQHPNTTYKTEGKSPMFKYGIEKVVQNEGNKKRSFICLYENCRKERSLSGSSSCNALNHLRGEHNLHVEGVKKIKYAPLTKEAAAVKNGVTPERYWL